GFCGVNPTLASSLPSEAQVNSEPVSNQFGNHPPRPQTKIEPILTWVFAVDPTKNLPLLRFRQFRRTPRSFARAQNVKTTPFPFRRPQPFVDRCAAEAVGGDHFAGILALPHALNGHAPDLFQRLVVQLPPVSPHAESIK